METPTHEEVQRRILNRLAVELFRAKQLFPKYATASAPKVTWKFIGKTAGTANWSWNEVSFQVNLARENMEAFLNRTVPHEVAHLVDGFVFGTHGHGRNWRRVMRTMGYEAVRCHQYSIVGHTQGGVEFKYRCGCRDAIWVSKRMHNGISCRGYSRFCRTCHKQLVYTHEHS